MKKVLFFASALAGLFFAASCQQETLEPEQMSKTVTFTVEAPGALATKGTINAGATIADGTNVNEVHFEVYKNVEGVDHALLDVNSEPMAKGVVEMANKKANITLDLLQDQEYTVIFWAQVKDAGHYDTSDLRCVELANSAKANDETRAAFFKRFDFDTYEHRDYPEILLRRPFAQLNLLTTMESLKPVSTGQTSGYEIDAQTSQVIVTGLAASFNTVTGIGNYVDYPYTFNMYDTPEEQGQATLEVNGKKYHYVSMNYMFVPVNAEDGSATVDIAYEIVTDKGSIQHEIANVPIRENYRTNVIGNLFTKESKFEIIVDANFDGQELVEVWDGREVSEPAQVDGKYVISTAAELAWLSAAVNGTLPPVAVNGVAQPTPAPQKFTGKTFMLLEDIDLANPAIELPDVTWIPIGANGRFEGTFDGNGKTIRNLVVKTEGETPAGLFGHVQTGKVMNVTVEDATVEGHASAAVIVAHGVCAKIDNCHVENAIVLSTPYNKDEANNVGAIAGFLGADGGSAWVKGCTVNNAHITAYRKVGGVVGAANQAAVVTGNSVENINVTADQTAEYKEDKDADLGAIVGYKHAQATVSENTETDVDLFHKVDSIEELKNAAAGAHVVLATGEYNVTEDLTVAEKAIEVLNGNVVFNAQNNTITAGSSADYAFIVKGTESSLALDVNLDSKGGGIAAGNGAQVTVKGGSVAVNSSSTSGRYNIYAYGEGTVVTIEGGEFSWDKNKNQKRAYIYVTGGATVYVTGGTFGKASTHASYKSPIMGDGEVIITGGTFGFDPSAWLAAGYVATKDGSNWVVSAQNLVSNAAELKEAIKAGNDGKIIVLAPGTYEGTFTPAANNLTIKSGSMDNKSVIKGRVNVSGVACSFENIKFEMNDASKHKNTYTGAPYQYPGIVVAYGAAMSFEGCEFEANLAAGVCGINAGNHSKASDKLVVNNCKFVGDFYAIRTRTLFSITNSEFDIYTTAGKLAAVWTWGNGNSGATEVTFTGNENVNANEVYGVQMTASSFVYDYVAINVQNNTGFAPLAEGVNTARFNGTHTFVEGSETF